MIDAVETYDRLGDAAAALSRGDARFVAGGTYAIRAANYGRFGASRMVRTTDPAFAGVRASGDRVEIGAGTTLAAILASRDVEFLHPVARVVGGPAVREAGTVGGNLFAWSPFGDLAAALLALDGAVRMADGRDMPLTEFFPQRATAGLVASVSIARPRGGEFRFRKVARIKPKGAAVLSVAAWLPMSGGRVQSARIAWCGMGEHPMRGTAAERALEGATLDASGVASALAAAAEGLSPADDPLASAWYRREVAPVHLKRLLLEG